MRNGIRCVGKYVYDNKLTDKTTVKVDTLSGVKTLELKLGDDGKVESVKVDMGAPILEAEKVPVNTAVLKPSLTDFLTTSWCSQHKCNRFPLPASL